ncbi:MAG: GGDEF domain-containing protein [Ruminococcus sp.]|nr:GGDEF domain-containing protein [Ruminococcus sp.]
MKSYNIALIIEEIDQSYQSAILNGISSTAKDYSMNVSAFVSFSGAMKNPRHDAGEFSIFSLPDFSRFDGAILLTNTIAYQPVVDDILLRIKEAGIPAVSIDNDIPYLYHIGIDNRTAMRNITEHLINVHGYKRFFYISGPDDNPESADRLAAFLEVIAEHGLSIDQEDIYHGDFRAHSGKTAAEKLLASGNELPDAIICANDVMAASAINYLTANGLSVPGDVAVTGFDNTYSTQNYQVELTSVDRPLGLSGRLACKMLYNRLNNLPQERNVILKMSTRFTESCGCCENISHDIEAFRELNYRNYMRFEDSQQLMSSINLVSTGLLGCNNFDEYISQMKKFVRDISPDEFYFCLCDNWDSESAVDQSVMPFKDEEVITTDYTDEMIVQIAYRDGSFFDGGRISRRDIIPKSAVEGTAGRVFYHIPLHFGERCLGYMVMCNPRIQMNSSMFETLCISISNSLENIRKLICLEYAVDRLGKLYALDTFSGIYNRNGFIHATESLYRDCVVNKRKIMLMFIDLDGLKKINDTFGHGVGDNAIFNIAEVLRTSCRSGEIYCRFGGDEFIVFGTDYTDEEAMKLKRRIQRNITLINQKQKKPYKLSASTGYVIDIPKPDEDIFRFVTAADNVMYTEKRRKKLSRYLKKE